MNWKRHWAVAIVFVTAAAVLAACSSSGTSGSASDSSSGSTSAVALTGSEIRIGFIDGLSGRNPTGVPSATLAPAWAKWVNANGGIGRHPVKVIIGDSKNDPGTAQSVVQDLVENQHVVAIMVQETTAEASLAPYVTAHHIPMIGGFGASPAVWGKLPNWYQMSTSIPTFISMSVVAAKAVGSTSFGAAICTDTATCQSTEPFYKSTAAAEGIKFAGAAGMPSNAPSYTAQCLTLIQAGSNSILLSLPPTVAVRVVNDCSQQGFSGSFILSGTTFDQEQFESYKGTSFIGGLMAFPWWSNAAPAKQFRDVMGQYAPKLNYRDAATTVTWAALELFRKAMGTPAGDVTSASVIKAYDSLHGETLGGLLPQPMTFTAGQPSPPVNCFWLYKYKAGDKDPVTVRKGPSGNGVQGDLASSCYTS